MSVYVLGLYARFVSLMFLKEFQLSFLIVGLAFMNTGMFGYVFDLNITKK